MRRPGERPGLGPVGKNGDNDSAGGDMNDDNRGPDDPMARWFAQFGGEGGSFDVQQMFEQLRSALGSMGAHQMGGIDWAQTTRAARQAVAAAGADPEPTPTQERAIADAHRLAAAWLDEFVSFDQVDTPPAAWSRAHWIDRTTSSWKSVAEPIVNRIAEALAAYFASQFESGEGVPAEFEQFARGEARSLKVYGSDREVVYDPQKRVGVMRSKIGASKAISLGAYAFALTELDK